MADNITRGDGDGRDRALSEAPEAGNPGTTKEYKALSGLIQRFQLAARAGLQFGGNRDLYNVFGYKKVVTTDDFLAKYVRQDITTRIIDAPPTATWATPPEVLASEGAQEAWKQLDRKVKLWNAIYRADKLSRLNHFSLLLFGFDDTGNMKRPVNPDRVNEVLYVRPIGSRLVDKVVFNNNVRDARYGMPETYTIHFDEPSTKSVSAGQLTVKSLKDLEVHHSRVIHIVENPLEDSVFGTPIIEKVYNLLDDLLKVAGGTSETYWLTGNRGIQANVDKEMEINPEDAAALSDEIDEYMHQLRRFIRTRGVDLNVLEGKVPNPKETFEMIVALISGTTGIPKRILLGSEAGQLASEQDRANWAERIDERRALFAEPVILEPIVDLLQLVGIIPDEEVEFNWESAFRLSPLESSMTMAQTARAIGNISRQTGNKTPMQLTSRQEGREILGLEGDLEESELMDIPTDDMVPPRDEGGEVGDGNESSPPPAEEETD